MSSQGIGALHGARSPSISPNGQYVAFVSDSTNLVLGDTNQRADVFVRSLQGGTTSRASVATDGTEGNDDSEAPVMLNGGTVYFASFSTNLGGQPLWLSLYVRKPTPAPTTTLLLSHIAHSSYYSDPDAITYSASDDGRFVAFASERTDLVPADTNGLVDAFVRDGGETMAPGIATPVVSPSAINPVGSQNSTNISAWINDASPPVAWEITITGPSDDPLPQQPVRSWTGTINDYSGTASATWDGKDANGLVVPEGQYTITVTVTDDWGNQRVDTTGRVRVDWTPPVFSSWTPADGANNRENQPEVGVTASDPSGLDSSSRQLTIADESGTTQSVSTTYLNGRFSGTVPTTLPQDKDYTLEARIKDSAGNEGTGSAFFHTMRVTGSVPAEIAPVVVRIPSLVDCPVTSCSIMFRDVSLTLREHTTRISSTAHAGSGTVSTTIPLSPTTVTWQTSLGPSTRSAGLTSSAPWSETINADDSMELPLDLSFAEAQKLIGDVTISVPPEALRDTDAVLQMPRTTGTLDCPCPLPADPLPAPDLFTALEGQYPAPSSISWSSVEGAPQLQALPAAGELEVGLEGNWLPSGAPIINYLPGLLIIKVVPDGDIATIVGRNGGGTFTQAFPAPYTSGALKAGLDRYYRVNITPGTELQKLPQYAGDLLVEYASLEPRPDAGALYALPNDSKRSDQWNLFGARGIHMEAAWDRLNFSWMGAGAEGPLQGRLGGGYITTAILDTGIRGTHEDYRDSSGFNKVREGEWAGVDDVFGVGANSLVCSDHGNRVASVLAMTNNSKGYAGVNYKARIYPIGIVDPSGPGDFGGCKAYPFNQATAKALRRGGKIFNMSYGHREQDTLECAHMEALWYDGGLSTVGGKEASLVDEWPHGCGHDIYVAMSTKSGRIHSESHTQDNMVSAPGHDLSLFGNGDTAYSGGHKGTSFAAPHVAGLAQLMLAAGIPNVITLRSIWDSATPQERCHGIPCQGKINAARVVKAAMFNGGFEGSATSILPWTTSYLPAGTLCSDQSIVHTSGASNNTTYGGNRGVALKCSGAGKGGIMQLSAVTHGAHYYKFYAQAKTLSANRA